jgi:hypothetical protein
MGLGRGEVRDHALNAIVPRISSSGNFDRSLLQAYSSDQARQQALTQIIPALSRSNPDEAQDLLGLVTNGTIRRQIEDQIAQLNARQ